MNVLDLMTRKVVSVTPETPVATVAKLLAERRLSAVPVIDPERHVLGIISEGDLMRRPETGTERHSSWWLRAFAAPDTLAERYMKSHGLAAKDVMTHTVVTIAPDASLAEAAELMERNRVKRLPVTQEDRIIGIIARADLVRALAAAPPTKAGADDDSTNSRASRRRAGTGTLGTLRRSLCDRDRAHGASLGLGSIGDAIGGGGDFWRAAFRGWSASRIT